MYRHVSITAALVKKNIGWRDTQCGLGVTLDQHHLVVCGGTSSANSPVADPSLPFWANTVWAIGRCPKANISLKCCGPIVCSKRQVGVVRLQSQKCVICARSRSFGLTLRRIYASSLGLLDVSIFWSRSAGLSDDSDAAFNGYFSLVKFPVCIRRLCDRHFYCRLNHTIQISFQGVLLLFKIFWLYAVFVVDWIGILLAADYVNPAELQSCWASVSAPYFPSASEDRLRPLHRWMYRPTSLALASSTVSYAHQHIFFAHFKI